MNEFLTDEFESHFSAFVNEDENNEHEDYCCYDKDEEQGIEAELYQQIYFESNEQTSNNSIVNTFLNNDSNLSQNLELDTSKQDDSTSKKKRRQKDKNESSKKKLKKECADPSVKIEKKMCINQIEVISDNENIETCPLIQSSLIRNKKRQSNNSSIRAAIEAAGITFSDVKKIVNKDLVYKDISFGYSSDSGASKDGEISRIDVDANQDDIILNSEDDSDGSYYGNDDNDGDDDINLNIIRKNSCKSKSLSDSILEAILKKMPDDSSWDISESDTMYRGKVSSLRFYNSSSRARCHNCNERGHLKDDCPEPKKVPRCILCGKAGHVLRNCADQICFRCGRPGHTSRDCDEKVASRADRCRRCFARGHFEERCPDNWRQYHLTVTPGEIIRRKDIPGGSSKNEMIRTCYNCGRDGHLGHVCTESKLDKFQTVFSPFVFKYDRKPPCDSLSERKVSKTGKSKKDESTSSSTKRLSQQSSGGGRHNRKSNKYSDDDDDDCDLEITFDTIRKPKVSKNSSKSNRICKDDSREERRILKDEKLQRTTHKNNSKLSRDKIDKDDDDDASVLILNSSSEEPNKSCDKSSSSTKQTSKKLKENSSETVLKTILHKSTSDSSFCKKSYSSDTRNGLTEFTLPPCDEIGEDDHASVLTIGSSVEEPNKSCEKSSSTKKRTIRKLKENGSKTILKSIEYKSTSNSLCQKKSNSGDACSEQSKLQLPSCAEIDEDDNVSVPTNCSVERQNKLHEKSTSSTKRGSRKLKENGSESNLKTIEHKSPSESSFRKASNSFNTRTERTKLMLSNDFPRSPVRNNREDDKHLLQMEKNGGKRALNSHSDDDDDDDLPAALQCENLSKSARRKKLRKEKRIKASIEERNAEESRTPKFKQWWKPNGSSGQPMSSTPISSRVTDGKINKESKRIQSKTPTEKADFIEQQKIEKKQCNDNNVTSASKNVITTPRGFRLTLI